MSSAPRDAYLDNAATTSVAREVQDAMLPWFAGEPANPSATHAAGVRARRAIDAAREAVRAAAGGAGRVVFTSGGTEANNLAVRGLGRARKPRPGANVVVSAVEHPSVREPAAALARDLGCALRVVPVDANGRLDLAAFERAVDDATLLVALIHGQNETGVLQPVAEAAAIARRTAPRAFVHADAVQSFGKVDVAPLARAVDSLSVSAHKIHGPKGAGALVIFGNASPQPLLRGGGQEQGLRSGTENVPALVGFGAAARAAAAALDSVRERLERLHARLVTAALAIPDVELLGGSASRLPSIAALLVRGVRGEVLQHHLEMQGVLVGTGSACHAAKGAVPESYTALGLDEAAARSVVRVSLAADTPDHDVERFAAAFAPVVARLRELVR